MAQFMRMPEVYWSASDAMAPPPAAMQVEEYLLHPFNFTIAAMYNEIIIGYVLFVKRTSIGAELHTGFHPQARGKIAKAFIEDAIHRAFTVKGLMKLWAIIPADNRRAILGAKAIGFTPEGRLTKAMVRGGQMCQDCPPGLYDLLILGMSK
jgi:RimJ/RimL family protein N-acetyltransferase